jgi:hypothetical protein
MYANSNWHSNGLRWIEGVITELADFMDRMDSAPGGRASISASEACDEARARMSYRAPYY